MARLRLRVRPVAESMVRSGHPWLFAESITEQNRAGRLGELAVVYDRKDRFLAVGLFDPNSPIRVRVLSAGKAQTIDNVWWAARLKQALERRTGLFDGQTNGYRLIHGESDGWPGLVLDKYDRTLVLKLYSAIWLPRLDEVARLILGQAACHRLVLRLSRNIQDVAIKDFKRKDGECLYGSDAPSPAIFLESGLSFEVDVVRGQKTGFFLDQRENRRAVESFASGRRVLNAFSFSGGFSLYAARGGARSVTDLDLSAHALDAAKRNFALNQSSSAVTRCPHECIQADAIEWLRGTERRKFDLIILDPPSFARRESERAGAIKAYSNLAADALRHLSRGGILVSCSCSTHVSAEEFFSAVRNGASRSVRSFDVLKTTGQPPDHPVTFKEAEYLKAIYLKV